MIEFKNINKCYEENEYIINDLSFTINSEEFFVVVGPSGSGKTTVLKMINRLIDPSSGEIIINDRKNTDFNLRELRLNIGYVLQQIALFPNLTVEENIGLIPEMKKWSNEDIRAKTIDLLQLVGLDPDKFIDRYPADLSGGEQQRVGIVRAIIGNPKILLLDEPFSALDPIYKEQLQDLILDIHNKTKLTIVFVTHDMREALKLGDRICILDKGKVVQIDTPDNIKYNPSNEFVEEFFKAEM